VGEEEEQMSVIEAFMQKAVVTVAPTESVADVASRMASSAVGAVVVVDGEKVLGMFSERDLVTRVAAGGLDPSATPVSDVTTRDIVTVTSDTSLKACAEKLKANKVRHLPVVDADGLVGIISARDFFETVTDQLVSLLERARYDEQLRENIDPYDHVGGSYGR